MKVEDTGTEGCTTRRYTFAGDSNRTALASYDPDGDGGCQTTTPASTTSYGYDTADRIIGGGYVYDAMGRTTTVPKTHTSQAGQDLAGNLALSYAANDMVASLQQTVPNTDTGVAQVRKQTFGLDGSDRVSLIKGYTDSVQLVETLNHYDSDADSPAWTQNKTRPDAATGWATTWNRYVSDLAGGLAIDIDNTGKAILQLANPHGDIVATSTLGQAGIDNYTETDEYGQSKTASTTTGGGRYGWLGTHQRDTDTIGGLVLMGARLYASATGRFLSIDPIDGGNDNRYTYPADPINGFDVDGEISWGAILTAVDILVTIASVIPSPIQPFAAVARAVSWGIRVYRVYKVVKATRIVMKAARIARAGKINRAALRIRNKIGKNRVEIVSRKGTRKTEYDLQGRAHFNKTNGRDRGSRSTPHYTTRTAQPRAKSGWGGQSSAKYMKGRHVVRVGIHCALRRWVC